MNWGSWLLWGFASTVVLTSILAGSQGIGLTRMNIPYMLGTIFTPSRDRAKFIGFFCISQTAGSSRSSTWPLFRCCKDRHGGLAR